MEIRASMSAETEALLTHVVSVLWASISRVQKFRTSFITHVVDNRLEILSAADLLNVVNRNNAQPFTQAELDMMLAVRFHHNPSFSCTMSVEHGGKEGPQCVFPPSTFWEIFAYATSIVWNIWHSCLLLFSDNMITLRKVGYELTKCRWCRTWRGRTVSCMPMAPFT